jgi:hypothetical protein
LTRKSDGRNRRAQVAKTDIVGMAPVATIPSEARVREPAL